MPHMDNLVRPWEELCNEKSKRGLLFILSFYNRIVNKLLTKYEQNVNNYIKFTNTAVYF